MRWPWQRREQETAPRPALPAGRDDAARVSPMGWAFLPPLQRQLGDMPLVARTASFPSQLPAWQNPSFTGTLAHRVSADAPSGVIDGDGGGTGEPTVHSASPDLTLLAPTPVRPPPVQRAVASASSPADGSPAADAPLTTAAPTGLPVLAVQSREEPTEQPVDMPPADVDHSPEGEVPPETGQASKEASPATGETAQAIEGSSAPGAVPGPSTTTAPPPAVQRSSDTGAPAVPGASATDPVVRARPSVGGRRLGLGAPLPALPLVSDVPPVQRSTDVPPALGSEGAEGYVEVDIGSKARQPAEPAAAVTEVDVPTLGSAPAHPEDAATTSDTASPAPPALPVAPVQRSLSSTSGATGPEPVESGGDGGSPGATAASTDPAESYTEQSTSHTEQTGPHTEPAGSHPEPEPLPDVPASGTGDRQADVDAPTSAVGFQDRPVLAQRSIATPGDSTPASCPPPGPSRAPAPDVATPASEPRSSESRLAAPAERLQLQRAVVRPPGAGAAGLSLQRSIDSSPAAAPRGEVAPSPETAPDQDPVEETTADRPAYDDAATDPPRETAHSLAAQQMIAPTRPMLSTAAPLASLARTPVQRAEDTSGVTESHRSPPTLTTTPRSAPTTPARTPQLRSPGQPTQPPDVQRATAGDLLPRTVGASNGSAAASTTPAAPAPSTSPFPAAARTLPLAAASVADEPAVQTSLAEDPGQDTAAVPAEGAAVVAESRDATGSASTAASPGADAAGGASSPEQLEALAGRLFTPLMRRIRSEMLLDRERRGLRTDSW